MLHPQRAPTPASMSLGAYLRQAADELFHLDGRLWSSLRSLCLRPGELSRGWREGWGHGKFLSPIRLYLVVNLLFFLLIPIFDRWADFVTIGNRFDSVVFLPGLAGTAT